MQQLPILFCIGRVKFLCLCVLYLFCVELQAKARDPLQVALPDLQVIPGATWTWVGQNMAYNGVPMSIKMFEFQGSERQVEHFYTSLWKSKGHGQSHAKDMGKYRIIGHTLRGYYASVQYAEVEGTVKGKLVVTQVQLQSKRRNKIGVPKPPSSKILSRVESLDGKRRAETVTFESTKGVDFNRRYYENQLKRTSWSLVYERGTPRKLSVRHYQKGASLMQVTCKLLPGARRGSHIVVHHLK